MANTIGHGGCENSTAPWWSWTRRRGRSARLNWEYLFRKSGRTCPPDRGSAVSARPPHIHYSSDESSQGRRCFDTRSFRYTEVHAERLCPAGWPPVRRMGFGAMQLPGPGVFGPPKDRDVALAVLRRAIDAGVNHIDTAQFYGPDVANELLREALSSLSRRPGDRVQGRGGTRRSGSVAWRPTARSTPSRSRSQSRDPSVWIRFPS